MFGPLVDLPPESRGHQLRSWQLCLSAGLMTPRLAGFEDCICDSDQPACNGDDDSLVVSGKETP